MAIGVSLLTEPKNQSWEHCRPTFKLGKARRTIGLAVEPNVRMGKIASQCEETAKVLPAHKKPSAKILLQIKFSHLPVQRAAGNSDLASRFG